MNYSCDGDLFAAWAEATCRGRVSQDLGKRHNAAVIFKRSRGAGQVITRYEGLERLLSHFGEHIAHIELTPIGAPRRDWRKIIVGDGWIVARHPDLTATLEIADRFSAEFEIRADG